MIKFQLSSRPVLFIHIGTNKTGTSAIQNFCNTYRTNLQSEGILYPCTGCSGDAHYEISNALGFSHDKLGLTDLELSDFASTFYQEFEKSNTKNCVISSEYFVLPRRIQPVKKMFSAFDCKIVVYLRRHDYWWESVYAQAVKTKVSPPWKSGIKPFIKYNQKKNPNYLNYRILVDRWAKVFGEDNVIVRPYESVQNTNGVISDFFHAIGHPKLAEHAADINLRMNESLSPEALFVLDLLQRSDMKPNIRNALIARVKSENWSSCEFRMLSPRFRRRLIEQNQSDYDYISRKYLRQANECLFSEPIPGFDEFWEEPVYPDLSKVISWLVTCITDPEVKS